MESMNIPDSIAILMARALCGEASPEELAELSQFAAEHPGLAEGMEKLEKLFQKRAAVADAQERQQVAKREQLQRLMQRARAVDSGEAPVQAAKRLYRAWYKYAAVLLLPVAGLLVWQQRVWQQQEGAGGIHTIAAAPGSRTRAMLPDGSKVWLNAGSSISYRDSFNSTTREVTLAGEAFFEVAKNANAPFVVHVGNIDVNVLGTSFNVKLYEGDTAVETTLISGMVEVRPAAKNAATIRLRPHQKLIMPLVLPAVVRSVTAAVDAEQVAGKPLLHQLELDTAGIQALPETAWVYNRLVFKNDNFALLAGKLSRWYGVAIVFDDDLVQTLMFTGSFENETIDEAMLALQKVSPFIFKKIANEIHIVSEK